MRRLLAVGVLAFLSVTLAQITAMPRAVDPGLIFDLLGTANAVEMKLSGEIKHVFLVAVHEGEMLVDATREVPAEAETLALTAGALIEARGCQLLLFVDLQIHWPGGRGGNRGTRCLAAETDGLFHTARSPLASLTGPLELPPNKWLAVEVASLPESDRSSARGTIDGYVVFYVYLSSQESGTLPPLPEYETWQELQDAFR